MLKTVFVIALSLLMAAPLLFFEFIFASTYPFVTLSVVGVLLYLFPSIIAGVSGFRYGALSGLVWALTQIILLPKNYMFLFLSLIVFPLSVGLASKELEDKGRSVILIVLAVIIQIGFRLVIM